MNNLPKTNTKRLAHLLFIIVLVSFAQTSLKAQLVEENLDIPKSLSFVGCGSDTRRTHVLGVIDPRTQSVAARLVFPPDSPISFQPQVLVDANGVVTLNFNIPNSPPAFNVQAMLNLTLIDSLSIRLISLPITFSNISPTIAVLAPENFNVNNYANRFPFVIEQNRLRLTKNLVLRAVNVPQGYDIQWGFYSANPLGIFPDADAPLYFSNPNGVETTVLAVPRTLSITKGDVALFIRNRETGAVCRITPRIFGWHGEFNEVTLIDETSRPQVDISLPDIFACEGDELPLPAMPEEVADLMREYIVPLYGSYLDLPGLNVFSHGFRSDYAVGRWMLFWREKAFYNFMNCTAEDDGFWCDYDTDCYSNQPNCLGEAVHGTKTFIATEDTYWNLILSRFSSSHNAHYGNNEAHLPEIVTRVQVKVAKPSDLTPQVITRTLCVNTSVDLALPITSLGNINWNLPAGIRQLDNGKISIPANFQGDISGVVSGSPCLRNVIFRITRHIPFSLDRPVQYISVCARDEAFVPNPIPAEALLYANWLPQDRINSISKEGAFVRRSSFVVNGNLQTNYYPAVTFVGTDVCGNNFRQVIVLRSSPWLNRLGNFSPYQVPSGSEIRRCGSVTEQSGVTYQWSKSTSGRNNLIPLSGETNRCLNLTNSSPGLYCLTTTYSYSPDDPCQPDACSSQEMQCFEVFSEISHPMCYCPGIDVTITAENVPGADRYIWDDNETITANLGREITVTSHSDQIYYWRGFSGENLLRTGKIEVKRCKGVSPKFDKGKFPITVCNIGEVAQLHLEQTNNYPYAIYIRNPDNTQTILRVPGGEELKYAFPMKGTYEITLSDNCNSRDGPVQVEVLQDYSHDLRLPRAMCAGSRHELSIPAGFTNPQWSISGSQITDAFDDPLSANPIFTMPDRNVRISLKAKTPLGCEVNWTFPDDVGLYHFLDTPQSFVQELTPICPGRPTILWGYSTSNSPVSRIEWFDSHNRLLATGQQLVLEPQTDEIYYFQSSNIHYPSGTTCSSREKLELRLLFPAQPAGPDRVICRSGGSTTLGVDATFPAGTIFEWTPSEGLSQANVQRPVANPSQSTTYRLRVATPEGCEVVDEVVVRVLSDLDQNVGIGYCKGSVGTFDFAELLGNDVESVELVTPTPSVTVSGSEILVSANESFSFPVLVRLVGGCELEFRVSAAVFPLLLQESQVIDIDICENGGDMVPLPVLFEDGMELFESSLTHRWVPADILEDPSMLRTRFNTPNRPSGELVLELCNECSSAIITFRYKTKKCN